MPQTWKGWVMLLFLFFFFFKKKELSEWFNDCLLSKWKYYTGLNSKIVQMINEIRNTRISLRQLENKWCKTMSTLSSDQTWYTSKNQIMRELFNKSHVTNISAGQGFLKHTVFKQEKENKKKTQRLMAIRTRSHTISENFNLFHCKIPYDGNTFFRLE